MPITLPVATLIAGAAGTGASVLANRSASRANQQATATQTDYNNRALQAQLEQQAYDRQQQAADRAEAIRQFNQNYGLNQQQFGFNQQQADLAQSNLVNRRDYSRGQFGSYLNRLQPFAQAGQSATTNLASVLGRNLAASIPTAGSGNAMVTLRAPNGQVSQVPAEHADHYISQGAVRV